MNNNIDDIWFNTINMNSQDQIEYQIAQYGRGILKLKDPHGQNALTVAIKNEKWESFLTLLPEFEVEDLKNAQKVIKEELEKIDFDQKENLKDKIINFFTGYNLWERNLKRYNFLNDCEKLISSNFRESEKPILVASHHKKALKDEQHTL